ncbi:MAG: DUF805 domain-containing protein [Thiocapsa sp.]|nr:DUF805 domain-containing protein [Thiocapsa sp.]MCG6898017.1 DUF805 domain-containing protein [Thiocapsa sp.]
MIKTFFGDIADGRLARLPYLGHWVLLSLAVLVLLFGIGAAIGVGEQLIGGDLQQAQAKLREWFTLPFFVLLGLVVAVVFFAGANLTAKRIRDIGLPGWWSVLAIALLVGIVTGTVSEQVGSSVQLAIWLALVLVPSNVFAKR